MTRYAFESRRIGPPNAPETLRDWLRTPLLVLAGGAVGATFVLLIKIAFGDLDSIWSRVEMWAGVYAFFGAAFAVWLLLNRRWMDAAFTGLGAACVAFLVWRFAMSAFAALGWVVPPVNP